MVVYWCIRADGARRKMWFYGALWRMCSSGLSGKMCFSGHLHHRGCVLVLSQERLGSYQ